MNTLQIRNLTCWGSQFDQEKNEYTPQRISIDVKLQYDFTQAIETDDLANAVDYKKIELTIKDLIEQKPFVLIERLASDIANIVLSDERVDSVKVMLRKPFAYSFGMPVITYKKKRDILENSSPMEKTLGITKEMVDHFYNPKTDGMIHLKGTLYSILDKEKLIEWYQKKSASFEKKDEKFIENNQDVSVVYNGPFGKKGVLTSVQEIALHTIYYKIKNELAKYSEITLKQGDRLETKLIKYPISELGVGAHKDFSSNINCIAIFNLYGTTKFYTATDKKRSNEKAYLVEPGDILLMRGPRNSEENEMRPIHYVLEIKEERLAFICREVEDEIELQVNKDNWMGF